MSDIPQSPTPAQDTTFGPLRATAALGTLATLGYAIWEMWTAIQWSTAATLSWRAQLLLLEGGPQLLLALGFGCAAFGKPAIRRAGWLLVAAFLLFAIVWPFLVHVHPTVASYVPLRTFILVSALDQATRSRLVEAAGRKYSAQLFTFGARYCNSYGIDSAFAQDAVQDIFLSLLSERDEDGATYSLLQGHPSQLKAYLFKAVQLRVRTLARSESRRFANEGDVASMDAGTVTHSPAELHDAMELEEYIDATLARCAGKAVHAYWLVRDCGLTYKETGEVMGIATHTVGAHVSSIAKQLRAAAVAWQSSTSGDVV